MTIRLFRSRAIVMAATVLAAPLAISPMLATPAHAQFGRIVFDPSNYAQNILTAARTLEQINHQITSLQNEATMLMNQARNLASLPFSSLQQLQQNVQRTTCSASTRRSSSNTATCRCRRRISSSSPTLARAGRTP